MTQLQVALDGTWEQALDVVRRVVDLVDIVEIGTPLLYREGINVVPRVHELAPTAALLADLKIMDAGDEEASIAFGAGCTYVTVMGVANDKTIRGCVDAARRYGRKIVADMMQVEHPDIRGRALLDMGCDILCAHTAFDQLADSSPLAALRLLREALPDAQLAVAGGVSLRTISAVLAERPDIIVVGGAIARAADPAQVARALRTHMDANVT
jgi:3-hexulose-6-phosphate synthase